MNIDEFARLLSTQRAIRAFTDQPVDDATVEQVLSLATFAPSAANRQPWRFIVIREQETKRRLGVIFDELGARMYASAAPDRTLWEDVPVLIAVCSEVGAAGGGASIFPCVQNLLLAAHALGLGTVLTTRWKSREDEVKPLLGLPDNMEPHVIVPMGWPTRRYGRGKRLPVAQVTYRERFGEAW